MGYSGVMNSSVIKASGLTFRYSDGTPAIEDISMDVREGESLAVIGPNGAGKSTLLLALMGLLPCGGDISVFGQTLNQKSAKSIRRRMALVFQDPDDQLFMPVLEEDVAFGPINLGLDADEVSRRVEKALSQMNLADKRQRPPHHLSVGEKRRAALATALSMEADVLLLDEPTSNLDPASRYELTEYLASFSATLIITTHDLNLAGRLCTKCLLLSAGRQAAYGPSEQILDDIELLRQHRLAAPK